MGSFNLKEYSVYLLLKICLYSSRALPKKVLYGLSMRLVSLYYKRKTGKKEFILESLVRVFPRKTKPEIDKIADDHIEHLALSVCEMVLMLTDRFDYEGSVVNIKDVQGQIRRLSDRPADKGVLFILGHYGNWEVVGQFFALNGMPTVLITNRMRNRYIENRILIPFRTKNGSRSVPREKSMIAIATEMKRGGVSGLLIDQMIPPPNGVEVDFFGQRAYTAKSIAQLKLKFDPLVIPLFPVRVAKEKFRIEIGEPIDYVADELLDKEDKIVAMTQYYTKVLEKRVVQNPEQWQWSYKRWRRP